jgi:Catalytic LigB subunit of aromatic ring-opening dioxygenase
MGAILGLGITHQPTLAADPIRPGSLQMTLKDPGLPAHLRVPSGWPEAMRREWGEDQGASHASRHRQALFDEISRVRQRLDAFAPDVIVIWGDDQYENFKEDVVPAFCVMGYDALQCRPWTKRGTANFWHEPADLSVTLQGHRQAARYLAGALLENSFDVAYAYKPLHTGLGHAFLNSALYLDWERKGFNYPVVPISVNCYGRRLMLQRGHLADMSVDVREDDLDPPSPSPARCFDLGAACARAMINSRWRVALIASSSWSHAFLTPKHHYLYPDHAADQALYDALLCGDYQRWRDRTLAQIEDSGQQEMLNWFCLVGAMAELGRRVDQAIFVESSIMNSNKVIASFST